MKNFIWLSIPCDGGDDGRMGVNLVKLKGAC
jgi:hypothetical protein